MSLVVPLETSRIYKCEVRRTVQSKASSDVHTANIDGSYLFSAQPAMILQDLRNLHLALSVALSASGQPGASAHERDKNVFPQYGAQEPTRRQASRTRSSVDAEEGGGQACTQPWCHVGCAAPGLSHHLKRGPAACAGSTRGTSSPRYVGLFCDMYVPILIAHVAARQGASCTGDERSSEGPQMVLQVAA